MMKTLLAISFFTIFFSFKSSAQNGTGLIFDDDAYKNAPHLSPALRFSDENIPQVYSLRRFCPTAGDQGQIGSCVGWSTGYATLTIAYAVKYNLTSQFEINKRAKSALFIFNQLRKPDISCTPGLYMDEAMNWLIKNGDCDLIEFNPHACDVMPTQEIKGHARDFPIDSYNTLFGRNDGYARKVSAIINSISQNKPVAAGFSYVESLQTVGKTGVWKPRPEEIVKSGHAMCIVGYDNINKQFEILNSWGTDFGNNGYFKMSYEDFAQYCNYAYNLTLGYTKEELAKMLTLTGSFYFKKFIRVNDATQQNEFINVNPFLSGNVYTFNDGSVRKDDFYRLVISDMQKDSYLYIFSLKPDGTAEILFPLSASINSSGINDLALIPASSATVELPADESRAYSTDIAGDDILCLLYSNQKIADIKNVVSKVNTMSGDLFGRLQKVLGDRLVPINKIHYVSSSMAFSTTTMKGNIVPVILKVSVAQ